MIRSYGIRVTGKVQGVFFRASTKEKADQWKIRGTVRNEPDGSVYIVAEAEEDRMEKFLAWCRHGPPRARVDNTEVTEVPVSNYSSFEVVY